MQNFINRFVAKRRNILVRDNEVKDVLLLINDNLSIWRKGIRIGKNDKGRWYIGVLATNDEWDLITEQIKLGGFEHVLYERKGFYRI